MSVSLNTHLGTTPTGQNTDGVKPGRDVEQSGTVSAGSLNAENTIQNTTMLTTDDTQRVNGANDAGEVTLYQKSEDASPLSEVNLKMLMGGGVNLQAIFKELFDLGKLVKAANRIDRDAHLNAVESLAKNAAQEIRSSALCSIIATSISSVGQIAGGVVALRGASISQETYNTKMSEMTTAKPNELNTPKLDANNAPKLPNDPKVTNPKLGNDGPSKLKPDTDVEVKNIKSDAKLKPDTDIEMKDIKSDAKLKNDIEVEKTEPKVKTNTETPDPKADEPKKLETTDFIAIEKLARDAATQAGAKFGAISTMASGGGQILGGIPTFISQRHEASRAELQAESSREQSRADQDSDYKQAGDKLLNTVIDKLAEIERSQAQAMSGIARMG